MKFSVVIPTHDTRDLVLGAIESVVRQSDPRETEILLVDDGSSDGTAAAVRAAVPGAAILRHAEARGFSAAANAGLAVARGEILLLLNSDAELRPGALAALERGLDARPELGVAGGRLYFPDGRPQWSGGRLPTLVWLFALASGIGDLPRRLLGRSAGAAGHASRVDWVSGAALAMRREVFERCGPLDDGYAFYCQDLDLCWCARQAGFGVAIVSGFDVIHHHGATIARDGGAAGQRPELLWPDLVRCIGKHRGPAAAAAARRVLRLGVGLRLLGRRLSARWAASGEDHEKTTAVFAAARAALGRGA